MKNRKNLQLLVGVLILVVLLACYLLIKNLNKEAASTEEEEGTIQVAAMDTEQIAAISFGEGNSFVKEDQTWYAADQRALPIDQDAMKTILENLKDIRAQRVLEDSEDLEEYGLAQPVSTIQITEDDGKETAIHIGDTNESVSACYAYVNDQKEKVYLLDTSFATAFDTTALKLAKKESFPVISGTTVTSLKVAGAEGVFQIGKNENQDGWIVTDWNGTAKAGDSSLVTNALGNLGSLSYGDMVAYEPEDLAAFGLSQPAWTVTVDYEVETEGGEEDQQDSTEDTTSVKEQRQLVLLVGSKNDSGNYYVKTGDSKGIYSMGAENLDTILDQDQENYLSKYVSNYSFAQLTKLEVTMGDKTYTLTAQAELQEDKEGAGEDEANGEGADLGDTDAASSDEDSSGGDTTAYQYYVDGQEKDMTKFMDFYNLVSQMQCQSRLDAVPKELGNAELNLHFYQKSGQEVTVSYYAYDNNYYLAVDDQGNALLVNKMKVKEMKEKMEVLTAER